MKYEIGQKVWWATFDATDDYIVCPDCNGMRYIRVLLYDDSIVTIACEGCKRGFDASAGRIHVYKRKPMAIPVTIKGLELSEGKTEWQTSGSYRTAEHDLFDTEAEALERANEIAADFDRAEREKISMKEKPTRSWSWHVHYYRREIREAQRRIDYATERLNEAKTHVKAELEQT